MSEQKTIFDLLGGAEGLKRLVDRFYDLMDLDESYAGIRAMHGQSLENSRDKLYLFLTGWTGGPDLYIQKYGHPKLKARHMPFAIGLSERDQWLECMRQAMIDMGIKGLLFERLMQSFFTTADWMRNQAG